MAGKRAATSQLNLDNLENDDEPEQAEEFQVAPEEVLKTRVIKVAKRRNPIGSSTMTETGKQNVFNSFSFIKPSTQPSQAFSFFTNASKQPEEKNSVNSCSSEQNEKLKKSDEYYAKLKGLNESVTKWIKQHVDANPFLNLTPIFKDYERYLEEIENLKPNQNSTNNTEAKPVKENIDTTKKIKQDFSGFSFKPAATTNEKNTKPDNSPLKSSQFSKPMNSPEKAKAAFSFGFPSPQNASSATTATNSQAFSFGSSNTQSTSSELFGIPKSSSSTGGGFSFTTSTPFTFTNVKTLTAPSNDVVKDQKEEEEDEEPPKNDFQPVIEEGHVFTVRCKVFVKKGDSYADKGVGNLFLKPIPDSDKTQLVVRADTSMGNILLNLILSESIPFQRMGKKDVMGVVLPTPDSKPPPIPILIRVKSPEEADNLLQQLEKYKK